MTRKQKILQKILSGSKNVRFEEFLSLLEAFGFVLDRTEGSHCIYRHPKVRRPFPVQSLNGKAKLYQMQQFLELVEQFDLKLNADEENET